MYIHYTSNPKHKESVNDCSIRSISIAEGRSWQDVMRDLCKLAVEECLLPNDSKVVSKYLEAKYGIDKCESFVNDYVTLQEFADTHKEGSYAVQVTGHGTTVVDGKIYDLIDSSDMMVWTAWKIK